MLHKSFNRNLHKLIEMLQWDMYLIDVDWNKRCSCLNPENNMGNPTCPHCLGIGYKFSIRKIKAVKQPYKSGKSAGSDPSSITSVYNRYFMDSKYGDVSTGDLIVHGKELDAIKFSRLWRSDSSDKQYYEAHSTLKRYNTAIFLKNFYKIINKK